MFTKTAFDVMKARDIVKRVVAPKFIRYARNGRDISDFAYHSPKAMAHPTSRISNLIDKSVDIAVRNGQIAPEYATSAKAALMAESKMQGALHGKRRHIMWGNSATKNFQQLVPHRGENPGRVKNITNDIAALHENVEMGVAPKAYKTVMKRNALPGVASHYHPDVLLQEHNMLTTLSGAAPKDLQAVKDNFSYLRNLTGEKPILDTIIPGGYATGGRLNRRMRRHISDKIISSANPHYTPAKPVPTP